MRISEMKYYTVYRLTWNGQFRAFIIDKKVRGGIEVTFLDTDEEDFIPTSDAEMYVIENVRKEKKIGQLKFDF
jgi:hypothetical protein